MNWIPLILIGCVALVVMLVIVKTIYQIAIIRQNNIEQMRQISQHRPDPFHHEPADSTTVITFSGYDQFDRATYTVSKRACAGENMKNGCSVGEGRQ